MRTICKTINYPFIVIIMVLLFLTGCTKKDNNNNSTSDGQVPVLTTNSVTNILSTSASSGGNITSDGGSVVTARGVCWRIGSTPTIADSKSNNGSGAGSFTSEITGLLPDTAYFVRAYAVNSVGIGYGNTLSFKTYGLLPILTTTAVTNITSNSASSGGNITSDGGSAIIARGVCWSTVNNPTTNNSKTTDGNGTGGYTSEISGLSLDSLYYVRAYATTSAGTGYGNSLSFKTIAAIGQPYKGGIIAYILQSGDAGYVAGQTHGLIAAPTDQSTAIPWCPGTPDTVITSMPLGTGNANTISIVAKFGAGTYAAKLCSDLILGSYSDWYLPSSDELYTLYLNRALIGGFNTDWGSFYWSSSIWFVGLSYTRRFYDGTLGGYDQTLPIFVRAVRSF